MTTPQQTDARLRSWLDTNQLARERLSLAVLALDKRFSDVTPRHPRGGPDGGRDIDAIFQDGRKAFAAVGFVNSACDSTTEKGEIRNKFKADLARALTADNSLKIFVFLTNVALTVGEKDDLVALAKAEGIEVAEVFDRERMRIALDSAEGLGLRFQYLSIPLSDAEQAAFFARWGSGLEQLITESIQAVDSRLERMEFFQEQNRPLTSLSFHFKLQRKVWRSEMPHFRALLVMMFPRSLPMVKLHLGVCDDVDFWPEASARADPGIFGIAWSQITEDEPQVLKRSISLRTEPLSQVSGSLNNNDFFGRAILGKDLKDLHRTVLVFFVDAALAELIDQAAIIANEYIVWRADRDELGFDDTVATMKWPIELTSEQLATPWKRVMADIGSLAIDFSAVTPKRLYQAEKISGGFR